MKNKGRSVKGENCGLLRNLNGRRSGPRVSDASTRFSRSR